MSSNVSGNSRSNYSSGNNYRKSENASSSYSRQGQSTQNSNRDIDNRVRSHRPHFDQGNSGEIPAKRRSYIALADGRQTYDPNVALTISLNKELNSALKSRDNRRFYEVLEKFKTRNVKQDVYTYSSRIQFYIKNNNPQAVKDLVDEMRINSISPTIHTLNPLLRFYSTTNSDENEILNVFNQIKAHANLIH